MYRNFFGIEENPFSNTPDPNYLFMSKRHKEALAHLIYGVEGDSGFVLLTGEVGTGKTTLCRYLADRLPENVDMALCINPRLSEVELLATICEEFSIKYPSTVKSVRGLTELINQHLLTLYARGGRAVLIIDEAQNMEYALLEQVRMLTNLETTHNKLLQIILIGQSELKSYLEQEKVRQLAQRITARYHLDPMTAEDTENYIAHRLGVAGLPAHLFNAGAISEIYKKSRGIPRLINSICERCLLGAYAAGKRTITAALARQAAVEVLGLPVKPIHKSAAVLYIAVGLFLISVAYLSIDPWQQNHLPVLSQSSVMKQVRYKGLDWMAKLKSLTWHDTAQPPNLNSDTEKPE